MYPPRTRDAGDRHGRRSAETCAPRERSLPPVRRTAFRRGHRGSGSPRITGSNFVRCAATADRLGDASRRGGGSAALNRNGRRSYARRRAAFRPPIRTAQSTPSILGTNTADRLGDASRRRGSAALNWNVRRSCARRRAAFRPPIRTAQSTRSILGTLPDGPNAQRRRNSELARHRRDAVTCAGPVVVDDFPQESPITRRELDVIETYLKALLDEVLGVPEYRKNSPWRESGSLRQWMQVARCST